MSGSALSLQSSCPQGLISRSFPKNPKHILWIQLQFLAMAKFKNVYHSFLFLKEVRGLTLKEIRSQLWRA